METSDIELAAPEVPSAMALLTHLLALEPNRAEGRAGLYRRAGELVPAAARSGPWDDLRDLTLVARADALSGTADPEVRRGALQFLAAFDRRPVAEALVAAVLERGGTTPELEALFAAVGPEGFWAVLRRSAQDKPSFALEALLAMVLRADAASWRAAAERSAAYGAPEVSALVGLAPRLPRLLVRDLARKLAAHPDPQVRLLAAPLESPPPDRDGGRA